MLHARIAEWPIHRAEAGRLSLRNDLLAIEEPLEIRIAYPSEGEVVTDRLATTMRTPGLDEELVAGFLFCEGIVTNPEHLVAFTEGRAIGRDKPFSSTITVRVSSEANYAPEAHRRRFIMTSSCGVCGKASLQPAPPDPAERSSNSALHPALVSSLPELQRKRQPVFHHTGGIHAASLFDFEGRLLYTFEDVGRHNAMDKLVGYAIKRREMPLSNRIVFFSGRVGYELMQKSIAAGVPVVAAVGAPSSLAVQLAEANGITLIGFVRESGFNVYAGAWRVATTQ